MNSVLSRHQISEGLDENRRVSTVTLVVVVIVIAVVSIPLGFLLGDRAQTYYNQKRVAESKVELGQTLADQVLSDCEREDIVSRALAKRERCRQATAVRVQAASVTPPPPVPPLPPPGVDQAQVDRRVDAYLDRHPNANLAMLTAVVADYLTHHPPKPGDKPTQDEIFAVVSLYLSTHAEDFRGLPGENASDDQIAGAVAAHCAQHNECVGATGDRGPGGMSFGGLVFQRDDSGRCMAIVTKFDPNDQSTSTFSTPVGDAACADPPPPPPTENTTETPPG